MMFHYCAVRSKTFWGVQGQAREFVLYHKKLLKGFPKRDLQQSKNDKEKQINKQKKYRNRE